MRLPTHPTADEQEAVAASDGSLWKGALAGAVAGAAGAFVMEQFQTRALPKLQEWVGAGQEEASDSSEERSEPATVKAANAVSRKLVGHDVPEERKEIAGEAAHYAMGVTSGILYGLAAERVPLATLGHGAAFGAAVWAIADEAVVPALKLSGPPTEHPLSTHAYALASHVVYGLTAETVRKGVRSAL